MSTMMPSLRLTGRLRRAVLAAGVALCGITVSNGAHADAGMNNQMNNVFTSLTVTDPTSIRATGRGGVSLGGVQAKSPIVNMNLVSFTPPNFNAGCGGIDMFAGSFSFINLQQFVSFARAVAANAAGFAFHLAIEAVSPQISQTMKWLQNLVNDLNKATHNSCQLAQGLVSSTGLPGLLGQADSGMSLSAIGSGFSDAWSSFFPNQTGGSANSPLQALSQAAGPSALQPFTGNIVWAALSGQNVDVALTGASDPLLLQELMSLTGTAILTTGPTVGATVSGGATAPGNPAPTGGVTSSSAGTQLNSQPFPRTIHVHDLLYGQNNSSGGSPTGVYALTYLKCDSTSGPNDCQNPAPATDNNYTPFTTLIANRLAGTNNGTGGNGIIDDIVNAQSQNTQIPTSDMQFLAALPGKMGADILSLSLLNSANAKRWVLDYQDRIAFQYLDTLLINFERSIDLAITASTTQQAQNAAFSEFTQKAYPEVKKSIHDEVQTLSTTFGDFNAAVVELERRISTSEKVVTIMRAPSKSATAALSNTGSP